MLFLENVLKPFHDDALGKLQIYTHSFYQWVTIVCTTLPLSAGEEGIEPHTKFSENWHVTYRISIFRGRLLGKSGRAFCGVVVVGGGGVGEGDCSFYIKSKN